jgi:hypothetical protein
MRKRIAVSLPVLTAVVIAGCGGRGAQGAPAATNPTPCPRVTANDLLRSPSTRLLSVAASSVKEVWAVGAYTDGSNTVEHTLVDHWNGRIWSTMRTPNTDCGVSNELRSVAASNPNNVWAVGAVTDGHGAYQPLTEHWDGSSWSIVATPAVPGRDGQLSAVTVIDSADAWAVGSYVSGDGASAAPQTLTEHWDGRAWAVVPSPNQAGVESSLRAIVATSSRDVWAGGRKGTFLPQAPLLLHWDGALWSAASGAPPPPQMFGRWVGADVVGLSARGPRDVWAVGSFFDESGSDNAYTLAEHWDGSSWSLTPVDAIIPSPTGHYFQAVTSFSSTDAWAVDPNYGIKHWDGTRWTKVAGAAPNALLSGIVGSGPADIWVVGDYSLIEHWNGSAWVVVPPPPPAWPTPKPLTG